MMHISVNNNFYILTDFDLDAFIEQLKYVITEYNPEVYKTIFVKQDNSVKFHRFFALEFFMLARYAKDYELAKFLYTHTIVKDLFKKIPAEKPKETPLDQQLIGYQKLFVVNYGKLKSLLKLDGYMLAMQPGMGKTVTAMATALAYSNHTIIVLCPKTLKVSVWANELEKFGITDYAIFPEDKLNITTKPRFLVTNYEQAAKLINIPIDVDFMIIDESQNFRFANRKKLLDIYELKKHKNVKNILLLTGTPIKGTYAEFSAAFLLLDPYFDMDAYPFFYKLYNQTKIAGERLLKERLQFYMLRLTYEKVKKEVVLPKKHEIVEEISLPNSDEYTLESIKEELKKSVEKCKQSIDQQKIAKELEQLTGIKLNLDNVEQLVLKKYEVLSKITDKQQHQHVKDLFNKLIAPKLFCASRHLAHIYLAKLRKLVIELFKTQIPKFKKLLEQNEKIVVFTNYVSIADQLKQLFDSSLGIDSKIVTGKYTLDQRTKQVQQFIENPNGDIIVITYKAASYGLTLTVARYLYYADLPFRDADLKQAIARVHRITQTRDTYIVYLKLKSEKKTIQDRKEEIIKVYKELVEELLDKPIDNFILKELQDELMKLVFK